MKFTCDTCSAQYMISDEKVGPAGVKVRCKKCGTVIPVKRPAAEGTQAPAEAHVNGAARPGGLDAELGQAFDHAFGDPPAKGGPDLGATQALSSEDAAKIGAAPTPAATEWYVAIGQAQVGPLPLVEVKRKWEAGDVGPESLVWRPGMADWSPLSSVGDLAGWLAAVPQASARPAARAEPRPERVAPRPGHAEPAAAASNGLAAEVSWKPAGASALAALATEELAARSAPAHVETPRAAAPSGVRSLVDSMNLPDSGGVDPTGAIPLPIKGLEPTGEKKIERRSSVARGAEEARHKRQLSRGLALGVAAVVLLGGGGYAAFVFGLPYVKGRLERKIENVVASSSAKPAAVPDVPLPPPPAAAKPAEPQPAPVAQAQPAVATAPTRQGPVAQTAAEARPAEPPPAAKAEPPVRVAQAEPKEPRTRRESAARRELAREVREARETRVAQAAPPPAPAPAPAAAPAAKKKDSVLDFDSNDAALDAALGGGSSSGRAVYVPPRPGGDLPAKVSAAQINESVAQRIDALRRCVSEQKAREPDATGVLKMRWTISSDGSVRDVRTLTPEYENGQFAQCITGVVKNIHFPQSKTTGQEVTFPFQF